MSPVLLLISILIPVVFGALMMLIRFKKTEPMRIYVLAVTMAAAILAWTAIISPGDGRISLFELGEGFSFVLRFDGLGKFFAGIVATLWPMTVLYAYEYMKHDKRQNTFFAFFTMAFGATLGVTMAGNMFTMYCFYEMLTLSTVPLVMHNMDRKSVRAAKTYFAFSIGGAAFAFASMMYLINNHVIGLFAPYALKGHFDAATQIFFLMGFFGFGVKAAVFPLDAWLPKAGVAPTPVTALLHAVAVVKSGVFAIIRLTYYAFNVRTLNGSWAQTVALCFVCFTIVYGSARALKENHFKRRLAYSTVANLSYILLGVMLLTEAGLQAGLLHMAFHAEMKILAFFCAGAFIHMSGKEYVTDLNGIGKKMPVTFICFTVSAFALTGIPPFSGFVSKWNLLSAAGEAGTPMAYIGAAAVLISALLTAMYMFTVCTRAWFPGKTDNTEAIAGAKETGIRMLIPMVILAVALLVTGLFAGQIMDAIKSFTGGLTIYNAA